jgi:hypothetical protein
MAMEHAPDCDGQHTARQPCNDAPTGRAEAVAIKTPPAIRARARHREEDAEEQPTIDRPAAATLEMPAPSPAVLRAWEETAAAVGATAAPAPPAHPIVEGKLARRPGWFAGGAGPIAVTALAALIMLVLARRSPARPPRGLKSPRYEPSSSSSPKI